MPLPISYSLACLQVLLPGCDDPLSEDGTLDLHVDPVEWAHDCFHPVLVDLKEEVLDGLLGGGAGGVRGNRRRGARRAGARARTRGLVKQEELDVCAGHKTGDVVVEELVENFQVPV